MRAPLPSALIALALLGGTAARAAPHAPVVVELYTAQGCAGCPEADRRLETIGARKGVVALTFPVDIWDYVGWADTFAKPAFTDRQRAYDGRLKVREIYTPEVIVNGRREASGTDNDAVERQIGAGAGDLAGGPAVRIGRKGARVKVSAGRQATPHADVWLVRFDPEERTTRVKTGDNKGKLVSERYVVRELVRLGGYAGGERSYALPAPTEAGLSTLVLVQGTKGGRIYGVGAA
jgi:hypothetical protein